MRGVKVVTHDDAPIHVSGHARADEVEEMIGLLRPRFLVPVHGEPQMQEAQARIAVARGGMDRNDVILARNGDVIVLTRDRCEIDDHVPVSVIEADGDGMPLSDPARRASASRTMADRDEIVRYLDETLEAAHYRDHLPLGLQVPGADEVRRVPAVAASLDVFERAAAAGGQLLIVHHGLFWDGASPDGSRTLGRRRLETLFRHDISLAAYHLPLDAHRALGNNAVLMALLGLEQVEPFGDYRGRLLGRRVLPAPERRRAGARLGEAIGSTPLVFARRPARAQRRRDLRRRRRGRSQRRRRSGWTASSPASRRRTCRTWPESSA